MTARNLLPKLAIVPLLAGADIAQAQFNSCALANSPLATGADPVNYTRMALRADGNAVLAYTTDVHNDSSIYFYDCDNAACSSGHVVYLDTSSNYYGASGIVIRPDGRPAITSSYFGGVRFYDCADADCTSYTTNQIRATNSAILSDMPITLQANGNPVFLYIDGGQGFSDRPWDLIVHFCNDAGCATGTEQILAVPPDMSSLFSNLWLAVGSDGLVAATYLTSEGALNLYTYSIARCGDLACTMVANTQLSAPISNSSPYRTVVELRSDQRPLALDSQSNNRALLDCTTSACTGFDNRLLPAGAAGQPIGLQLLTGDLGDLPAFALFNPLGVGAFACADSTCSSGAFVQASSTTMSILDADFAVDANAHPVITYIDFDTRGLAVAGCKPDLIFSDGFE